MLFVKFRALKWNITDRASYRLRRTSSPFIILTKAFGVYLASHVPFILFTRSVNYTAGLTNEDIMREGTPLTMTDTRVQQLVADAYIWHGADDDETEELGAVELRTGQTVYNRAVSARLRLFLSLITEVHLESILAP
jgi:hypothetical protein